MHKTIALVGNAPPTVDQSVAIDRCDLVVRINNACGFGAERGNRITHLALVNCGGQMREWLDEYAFASRPAFRAAQTILLPIHPDKDHLMVPPIATKDVGEEGRNHAVEAKIRFETLGKSVLILPVSVFLSAAKIIGCTRVTPTMPAPSTGLLVLVFLLSRYRGAKIEAFGFTFEGWHGHRWDLERAFMESLRADGRLCLHREQAAVSSLG